MRAIPLSPRIERGRVVERCMVEYRDKEAFYLGKFENPETREQTKLVFKWYGDRYFYEMDHE